MIRTLVKRILCSMHLHLNIGDEVDHECPPVLIVVRELRPTPGIGRSRS